MNARLIIPLVMSILWLALNLFIYRRLRLWYQDKKSWPIIRAVSFVSSFLVLAGLILALNRSPNPPIYPTWYANYFIGFTFSLLVGMLLYGIILIIDWVLALPFWTVNKFKGRSMTYSKTRRKFVQSTGVVLAGIPFLSLVEGITFGKYDYQVRNIALKFPDLPKAFHGFKIAQISDIHSGSFDSKKSVLKGVQMVNEQGADLITFTGDLVNSRTAEIEPFIDIFSQLKAPQGVMSTKGNHDYGLYYRWNSQKEHALDQQAMVDSHKALGFDLLQNDHRIVERDGEKICIAGVENWGKPPFPQYGDLDKSIAGTENNMFTVLLSHDPSHWEDRVIDHERHVHLTLSGHTHGMQFGVEIPGFLKWSPVKYRYPRWAGLYSEKDQYLYVNRGFGFIGYPGRVGIRPEITVFELQRT